MSQPNGLLILGDHLFLNYKKKIGQRGLINTAGIINPNLTLYDMYYHILSPPNFDPEAGTPKMAISDRKTKPSRPNFLGSMFLSGLYHHNIKNCA